MTQHCFPAATRSPNEYAPAMACRTLRNHYGGKDSYLQRRLSRPFLSNEHAFPSESFNMMRNLLRLWRSKRKSNQPKTHRGYRPIVENLEDRVVPVTPVASWG